MKREELKEQQFQWQLKLHKLRKQYALAETDEERERALTDADIVRQHLERLEQHL